jgi:hypothetical protein
MYNTGRYLSYLFFPVIFVITVNLLDNNQIKEYLEFLNDYIPSFQNLEKNSKYSTAYKASIILGFILTPFQVFIFDKFGELESVKNLPSEKRLKAFFASLLLALIPFFYMCLFFAGNVDGGGKTARFMRNVMLDKTYFVIFSSAMFIVLALGVSGLKVNLKYLINE